MGVPTFVFADRDGVEVARLVGEQTEAGLTRALSALRGEPCPGLAILDDSGGHLHPDDAPSGPACPSGQADDVALDGTSTPDQAPACQGV